MEKLFDNAVHKVKSFGYRVFVKDNGYNSFAYFSDGHNIGYMQREFGGVSLSSVNRHGSYCSGFSVVGDNGDNNIFSIEELTEFLILKAFIVVPKWFKKRKAIIKKYKDLQEFMDIHYGVDMLNEI